MDTAIMQTRPGSDVTQSQLDVANEVVRHEPGRQAGDDNRGKWSLSEFDTFHLK